MRQTLSFLFMCCFAIVLNAQAQQHWCGSLRTQEERDIQNQRVLENIRTVASGAVQFRDVVYIPVKFHLAARNDGSGRVSEAKVLAQLCELNEDYLPYDMQFFLADGTFNYINNTNLYENHEVTQNTIMQSNRDSRAVNIFIVESVDDGAGGGVTLAYYHTVRDWIVSRKASVDADNSTIPHEMGHFFSMPHTFNGWESGFFETQGVNAPVNSPGGIPTERQNGSNCATAGDFFCDTPPDYGFSDSDCTFNLNILDPLGVQVQPDESNFMSYFLSCPDDEYHFSDEQSAAMMADYNSPQRNYLRLDPVPDVVEINDTPELLSPQNAIVTDYYNSVGFSWTAVDGADHYLLEISRTPSMNVEPVRVIVEGTSYLVTDLDADRKYYWRVRPFNAHRTCASPTSVRNFETGTDVTATIDAPAFVDAFTVAPNPVAANASLNLNITSTEQFEGRVDLVDIAGRVVKSMDKISFNAGENNMQMTTNDLASGLYFLQLQTQKGQITKKIVVSK